MICGGILLLLAGVVTGELPRFHPKSISLLSLGSFVYLVIIGAVAMMTFAAAAFALKPGQYTKTPVKTQFGWHVIEVDDIRDAKIPSFDEVKPQLAQRMQAQVVDQYLKDLRAKNGY